MYHSRRMTFSSQCDSPWMRDLALLDAGQLGITTREEFEHTKWREEVDPVPGVGKEVNLFPRDSYRLHDLKLVLCARLLRGDFALFCRKLGWICLDGRRLLRLYGHRLLFLF